MPSTNGLSWQWGLICWQVVLPLRPGRLSGQVAVGFVSERCQCQGQVWRSVRALHGRLWNARLPPPPPMGGHRPLSPPPGRCAAGPLPCPPRPAEGSSALPCAVGQRGGRGGAGLPGPPRTTRAGSDCIVGRETGAPPGRTPGTASCSSARPAARSGRQEPGLARARGAGVAGSVWGAPPGSREKPGVHRPTSPNQAKALRRQPKSCDDTS